MEKVWENGGEGYQTRNFNQLINYARQAKIGHGFSSAKFIRDDEIIVVDKYVLHKQK